MLSVPAEVVAIVLRRHGKLGLFRRSMHVGSDAGLWHCITGYLDDGVDPTMHALVEVFEETGLCAGDMDTFVQGPVLRVEGDDAVTWTIHPFLVDVTKRRLTLDWEHDRYRWVDPRQLGGYQRVSWLGLVLDALIQPRRDPHGDAAG